MRASPEGWLEADGACLAWWRGGQGDPVVLVHGSWDDHGLWDGVVRELGEQASWLVYDRRGHSASTAPPGQGSIRDDAADLMAVLENLTGPAHVAGHSYGGSVALLAAASRPALVTRLTVYEPPLFGLVAPALVAVAAQTMQDAAAAIEAGDPEAGASLFLEHVAYGEGAWDTLFAGERRRTVLANAATWLDQSRDPDRLAVDATAVTVPISVLFGSASLPLSHAVIDALRTRLPDARFAAIAGAGHGAPMTHPAELARAIVD